MFGVKSFGRVIEDAGHGRPFYYYLTHFPPEFLPWTVFLPAAWIGLGPGPTRRRLAAWAAFVLVLFSLFAGKRNLYILLAYPAAAMLVATGWGGMAGVSSGWRRFTAWGALALLGLVALGSAVAIGYPDLPISRGSVVPTAVAALAGFVLSLLLYRRQGLSDLWLRAYAGSFAVVLFTVGTFAFPAANHLKGPGLVASRAHDVLEPGHPIHLFRHQLAIVPLYAERPGRMLRSADELRALLDRGSVEIVVFSAVDWASIRDDFDGPMEVHPFEFGHKDLVWVEFPGRRGG
jgi:hypothetical protein